LSEHAGQTVLAVSHVTPIKVLVTHAMGAPLESVHRMELAPASVTVLTFYGDGRASLRMFNARPTEAAFIGR
jgi:probable phosphoglycerate mutase